MTGFRESDHPRGDRGKFKAHTGALQDGQLDDDPDGERDDAPGPGTPVLDAVGGHLAAFRWARDGFTPGEAREWSASGFTPAEAVNWENNEFSREEAGPWHQADFTPAEARAWEDAGTGASGQSLIAQAVRWRDGGIGAGKAIGWEKAGITDPEEAREWRDAGITEPEEARAVIDDFAGQGADRAVALIWHARGFSAGQADRWWNAGGPERQGTFSEPVKAAAWRDAGFSPESAHAWHEAGMTTEHVHAAVSEAYGARRGAR